MSGNSFGTRFVLTSFGESHGPALGAIIDGCPAGVTFDSDLLAHEMLRRRPGTLDPLTGLSLTSSREEPDLVEVLSGIYEDKTLGTPIAMLVRNRDSRSQDYANIGARAGHADDQWLQKFGHADPRGGGRASGRETAARVMGGAVAKMFLKAVLPKFRIEGKAVQIGPIEIRGPEDQKRVAELLVQAKETGKSYGGTAELLLQGVSQGLGQPVFKKIKAELAGAMMSVGAVCAVEIGDGFAATEAEGSDFHRQDRAARYGGIRGGITTGEPILIRVGFKPTSSVLDVAKAGRHDPCIVPRAIPVLEAMSALVIADQLLLARGDQV
ncbi:chorismate synthase [bacterium]|jgi:chorismate synthase|nr:chorismate synthase [bacterium]